MSRFVPLVQAWEASRQERTPMPGHQRVASIEYAADVERPASFLDWLLGLGDDDEIDDDEMEIGS